MTSYAYDAFGNVSVAGESIDNPFQYTGRENDGTGLLHYRFRYYSPEMRRFVSEDPIGLAGGINYYAYVQNNPIRFIDPYGLAFSDILPGIKTAIVKGTQAGVYAVGQSGQAIVDIATNGPPVAKAALGFAGVTVAAPLAGKGDVVDILTYVFCLLLSTHATSRTNWDAKRGRS